MSELLDKIARLILIYLRDRYGIKFTGSVTFHFHEGEYAKVETRHVDK